MKVQLLELMENLVHQSKRLILTLVKQTQNFVSVYIIMMIIVIFLLIEKKYVSLKSTMKMLTFQLNLVLEAYLMDLVLASLEKKCVSFFSLLQFY